ncbi:MULTISPECIES: hypothetical protein [unclassified Tolypothrix]|uniref:hypothetical protein n=1 Tax=unclassified Tolypothrix TaxID=2649714 RepID=UPI0005F7EF35|nr:MULTISPECIES: hypothetical protein [unclassified Tolypothrix]MBE9085307.1 hypothetical protein [Tolypothrix sp. LEGE 11397]UYD34524.1 hypothetical protein HG267_01320 [Tolypothrix sp. PCC 7601]BAY88921.1 hypothetical protein NIES3275_09210 [Microchaete diplosiphon NIES-3275]
MPEKYFLCIFCIGLKNTIYPARIISCREFSFTSSCVESIDNMSVTNTINFRNLQGDVFSGLTAAIDNNLYSAAAKTCWAAASDHWLHGASDLKL